MNSQPSLYLDSSWCITFLYLSYIYYLSSATPTAAGDKKRARTSAGRPCPEAIFGSRRGRTPPDEVSGARGIPGASLYRNTRTHANHYTPGACRPQMRRAVAVVVVVERWWSYGGNGRKML